MSKMEIKMR